MRQSGNDEKANEKFVRRMMQMALMLSMTRKETREKAQNPSLGMTMVRPMGREGISR